MKLASHAPQHSTHFLRLRILLFPSSLAHSLCMRKCARVRGVLYMCGFCSFEIRIKIHNDQFLLYAYTPQALLMHTHTHTRALTHAHLYIYFIYNMLSIHRINGVHCHRNKIGAKFSVTTYVTFRVWCKTTPTCRNN